MEEIYEKIKMVIHRGDICVSLTSEQAEQDHAKIAHNPRVKYLEWRADMLVDCPETFQASQKTRIITLRTVSEGGLWEGNAKEYFHALQALSQNDHDYIDVEYNLLKTPSSLHDGKYSIPGKIILSNHNMHELP